MYFLQYWIVVTMTTEPRSRPFIDVYITSDLRITSVDVSNFQAPSFQEVAVPQASTYSRYLNLVTMPQLIIKSKTTPSSPADAIQRWLLISTWQAVIGHDNWHLKIDQFLEAGSRLTSTWNVLLAFISRTRFFSDIQACISLELKSWDSSFVAAHISLQSFAPGILKHATY